jgi:hypothetical protein
MISLPPKGPRSTWPMTLWETANLNFPRRTNRGLGFSTIAQNLEGLCSEFPHLTQSARQISGAHVRWLGGIADRCFSVGFC